MKSAYRSKSQNEDPNLACAQIFAVQFGVISKAQARACGLSDSAIKRRMATGIWIAILPGIYRLAAVPATWQQRLMAAWLWGGERSAISHRSAAALHRFGGFESEGRVELTIPQARKSPAEWLALHVSRTLARHEVGKLGHLNVTSPTRTLIDIAGAVEEEALEIALDCGLRRRQTSIDRLERRLGQIGGAGRRGAAALRGLIEDRDPSAAPPQSPAETLYARLERRFKLPRTRRQWHVRLRDRDRYLDFAYPDRRFGIETDGREEHSGFSKIQKDFARQNEFSAIGWTVLHFTYYLIRNEDAQIARLVLETYDRLGRSL